jgi:TPR repeat protein
MSFLANVYHFGKLGQAVDMPKAISFYRHAAELNDPRAQCSFAVLLSEGAEGLPKDEAEALKLIHLAAEKNYPNALGALAIIYERGQLGQAIDMPRAISFYRRAGELNDPRAQFNLATLLAKGSEGLPKDESEALRLFHLSAAQNTKEAMSFLANVYHFGKLGQTIDLPKAISYFERAVALKEPDAQYNLAMLLSTGAEGLPKNEERAFELLNLAAKNNCSAALFAMGLVYHHGDLGQTIDIPNAISYYERAVALNNPNAQYNLAMLLSTGAEGLPKNEERAFELLNLAAKNNCSAALNKLGVVHKKGDLGQTIDLPKAISYFERAVALKEPDAQYNLAMLLSTGAEGLPKNWERCIHLLKLSSAQGVAKATAALTQIDSFKAAERDAE